MLAQDHARSTAAHDVADRPPDPLRAQPANGPADREFLLAYLMAVSGTVMAWGVVLVEAGVLFLG